MEKKKKKFYAVAKGRNTGIFSAWFGASGTEEQIRGYPGARYKGFFTIEEAREWLQEMESGTAQKQTARKRPARAAEPSAPSGAERLKAGNVVIYTDGGCSYNPGPGGYGTVILNGTTRKELSGGFRLTTNNRMELLAGIEGLQALKSKATVTLFSDSRYVVNGITKGWAKKWRANGWMRTKTDAAENYDLWGRFLDLCDKHSIEFVWVKGHAGNKENERCDQLATGSSAGNDLPHDDNYESGKTKVNS